MNIVFIILGEQESWIINLMSGKLRKKSTCIKQAIKLKIKNFPCRDLTTFNIF